MWLHKNNCQKSWFLCSSAKKWGSIKYKWEKASGPKEEFDQGFSILLRDIYLSPDLRKHDGDDDDV